MALHAVFAIFAAMVAFSAAQDAAPARHWAPRPDPYAGRPGEYDPYAPHPDKYDPAPDPYDVPPEPPYIDPGRVDTSPPVLPPASYIFSDDPFSSLRQQVLARIAEQKAKIATIVEYRGETVSGVEKISTLVGAWCRSK